MRLCTTFAALTILCLAFSPAPRAHYPLPPVMTGDLYVSSYYNHRVCVYDADGALLRDFTGGGLTHPRGLVHRPGGEVYVASQDTDAVLVFGPDDTFLRALDPPDLDGPAGMASGPDGLLYVCAANSNRVYVFDAADQWSGLIMGGGLSWPNGVAVDLHGDIYVTSVNTDDVRKYDGDGTFITAIGGGGLDHPTGLAISPAGILYVAGSGSNNVTRYAPDGTPLGAIEHEDFASPQSIAIDEEGRIHISQFFSDAIVVFSPDEVYEQTLTLGVTDGIAFYPSDPASLPEGSCASGVTQLIAEPTVLQSATRLRMELSRPGQISLVLYDVLGRSVRTLAAREFGAGRHEIGWDRRDGNGQRVPSGAYLALIRADAASSTIRLLVVD